MVDWLVVGVSDGRPRPTDRLLAWQSQFSARALSCKVRNLVNAKKIRAIMR